MPLTPPLCLEVGFNKIVPYATNQWTVDLIVTPQVHNGNQTYNGTNVSIGQWASNASYGFAWKIVNIISQTASSVKCILEDTDGFNSKLDTSGIIYTPVSGGAPCLGLGYLWELNANGLPVLTNLPNVPYTAWSDSILARFISQQQNIKSTIITSTIVSNNINVQNSWSPMTVAVGAGSTRESTIMLSTDSLNWSNANTGFDGLSGRGVAFNGSYWVAVGSGSSSASTIMTSTDASNWIASPTGFEGLQGNAVAWNGSLWVATGLATTSSKSTILYSKDAINWKAANLGGFIFTSAINKGIGIAWNGANWLALGNSRSNQNNFLNSSIQTSVDGSNWVVNATNSAFYYPSVGDEQTANAAIWNGRVWVAVGFSDRGIARSIDGRTWNLTTGVAFTGRGGYGVTWSAPYFIVVGDNTNGSMPREGSIKRSTDGISWTNIESGGFSTTTNSIGYAVTKADSYWIALGSGSSAASTILVSTDTSSWNFTNTGFALNGYGIATNRSYESTIISCDGIRTNNMFISKSNGLIGTNYKNLLELDQDRAFKPLTTTWNTVSDQRVKENIEDADINQCYSDIQQLQLRRFNFTNSFTNSVDIYDEKRLGFIAQEIETIIPKVVNKVNYMGIEDFHTINIDQVDYAHFGATQQLIKNVKYQESTLISLSDRLKAL